MKMTNKILRNVLLVAMSAALVSFNLPKGWNKRGDSADKYDMGIDKGAGRNGKNAGTVKSIARNFEGFGTLMQNFKPDKFLGKKIKLTGYLKCQDVEEMAGLWLRVDEAHSCVL